MLEGAPEVSVEQRVDERVQRRVDVADPEQNGDDDRRRFGAELAAAQRVVDVPREERQPAAQERAHDDAERFGRLVLASHLSTLRRRTVRNAKSLRRHRRGDGQRGATVAG